MPAAPPQRERIDGKDIKLLNAPNFALFCRQKGVTVMRTTLGELEQALRDAPEVELPNFSDSFFKGLLHRRGEADDYKAQLPTNFHEFINEV